MKSSMTKITFETVSERLCENDKTHLLIMDKIDKFSEQLEEIKIQIAKLPDVIFERGDKRYASKNSERVIYSMVGLIVSGFLLALWELIKRVL